MDRVERDGRVEISSGSSSEWPQARSVDFTEVLHGLSGGEADAITGMLQSQTYARGACIYSLGDQQRGLYFVMKGLVEEYRLTESGNKLPISRVGPGMLFGLSLVEGRYCCFAETVDESVIELLSFQTLEDLSRRFPRVAVNLIGVLARRLGEIEDRLEQLAFSSLRARVAWALLGLSAVHGTRLAGITHEALSAWVTSSRPKVSMVLEDLQQAGLLRLSRGQIEILDLARLQEWAKQAAIV